MAFQKSQNAKRRRSRRHSKGGDSHDSRSLLLDPDATLVCVRTLLDMGQSCSGRWQRAAFPIATVGGMESIWRAHKVLVLSIIFCLVTTTADAKWRDHTPSVPNPARLTELPIADVYVLGLVACFALKPMLSSAIKRRELTLKEAYESVAGCVLPFIGGWLVRRYFPEAWNALPTERWERDFSIKGY
jgi:hypothetical protein